MKPAAAWTGVERFEAGKGHPAVIRLAAVAALGGLLFGYDTSVINGAVAAIQSHFAATAATLGLTVSSALLGSALGAVAGGRIADRHGCLLAMRLAAVLFVLSAVGSAFAVSLAMLGSSRFLGGTGVGIASVIGPAYIAEIAPARIRGRLGSLQQLAIVIGIFVALLIDYLIAAAAGGSKAKFGLGLEAWRWMFLAMTLPAVAYGLLTLTIPESPRQLVRMGRLEEARKVLREVLGNVNVEQKLAQIRHTLAGASQQGGFADLRGPALGLLPIVWVGIGLSVLQQFVGINVIFYYSSVLWQSVGFSESDSLIITVITSVVNVATTLIAIASIDRVGRRPLLIVGSVGMAVTLTVLAVVFGAAPVNANGQPVLHGLGGPIALIAANLFVFSFGMSWGPTVWVLLGEMFPNRIRGRALGVAAGAQWISNWTVSTTFPALKNAGLGLAYSIYAAFAVLSLLFVLRFVTETKGIELEELSKRFEGAAER
ncbi:MAG: sugar transporter [Solirubrobacterales bacterium]|nr:sugar transporter [Solirubrobacterales bacterium]